MCVCVWERERGVNGCEKESVYVCAREREMSEWVCEKERVRERERVCV